MTKQSLKIRLEADSNPNNLFHSYVHVNAGLVINTINAINTALNS